MDAATKLDTGGYGASLFSGVSGTQSAVVRIYEDLRLRIISLELLPDTILSRSDLAADYNVSQTPIREAMQKLEQDGLVRIFPQSKTMVSRIDTKQLQETQFLRVSLEIETVRRLTEKGDKDLMKRARTIVRMQESIIDDLSQVQVFNDLDRTFHRTLFEGVGMQNLHHFLIGKLGHLARCQRLELPRIGKMQDILDSHKAILDGIESGDHVRATEAMRKHITGTILRVASLQDEFPDYFA